MVKGYSTEMERANGGASRCDTHEVVDHERQAISIAEFCASHGISKATFYNLRKAGKAPKTLVVGRRRLVSEEAAADWRRAMEEPSDSKETRGGELP